ncbi:MAG TPA: glycosyltransferase family 39 protein [Fimbriimonadales bacterium]|nr:glycosyltransferase family 39 protein [Fimbriimonadales bacterium]
MFILKDVAEVSPYIGFLIVLFLCFLSVSIGLLVISRWVSDLPVEARWGLGGAVGLGVISIATFFVGLLGWFHYGVFFVGLWVLVGVWSFYRTRAFILEKIKTTPIVRILWMFILLLFLLRLPSVLTPSVGADWDSVSHQLAMSKIWLREGKLDYIFFMHQSNIAPGINMLYLWGLALGGQSGAKTFAFCFALFAVLCVAGITAKRYDRNIGYCAALAFLSAPVALWEIGTAYVDVAHGLFTGSAILFSAFYLRERERKWLWLSGICLGFGLGTKYTGFQVAAGIVLTMLLFGFYDGWKEGERKFVRVLSPPLWLLVVAIAIASPWYVRNIVNTGNPIYPFFYEVFDGKNWNAQAAEAYRVEQQRFGIGQTETGKSWKAFPGSITALSLMPHLHINGGVPWGAMGIVFVVSLVVWFFSGKMGREEAAIMTMIFITLFTWFYLTQQSRYLIGLLIPSSFLIGGAAARLSFRYIAVGIIALQVLWSLFLFAFGSDLPLQLKNLLSGKTEKEMLTEMVSVDGHRVRRFPFGEPTEYINALQRKEPEKKISVALYDEVRGFYLDVDYFWANPGHHTYIPYDRIRSPEELVEALKKLGATHVYMNLDPAIIGGEEYRKLRQGLYDILYEEDAILSLDRSPESLSDYRWLILLAYADAWLELEKIFMAPGAKEGDFIPESVLFRIASR